MLILATSAGSSGDFLPTLAVAAVLKRRGHRVRFVANPFHEPQVLKAGLEFVPAEPRKDVFADVEANPGLTNPLKGAARLLDNYAVPNSEHIYRVLTELQRDKPADVILASEISFSAFWVAAEIGVPSVLLNATPLAWASYNSPAFASENPPPKFLQGAATAMAGVFIEWFISGRLRPLARRLGTKVADPSVAGTKALTTAQVGCWSPLLRGAAKGDPSNGTIAGFVRASALGGVARGVPDDVEAFLNSGEPPVVVGLGSIFPLASGDLLVTVAEACADIGRRCLIVGHPSAAKFPAGTLAVKYAPYDAVFPRCAAVVVHGGAGSTGEALRCGRPVLATPFAYDQFWMAAQVERLGVGRSMKFKQRTRAGFAEVIRLLLSDEAIASRAREVGAQFSAERDGAEVAADVVERIAARKPAPA